MGGINKSFFRDARRQPTVGESAKTRDRSLPVPAVETVLVVGAGAAGAAAAILLAEGGVQVDLVDIQPDVRTTGSGITLQGNALRVLESCGVWEDVRRAGYAFDELGIRAPDAEGTVVAVLADIRTGGQHLPATLGVHRPTLARILVDQAKQVGVDVRFGTTFTAVDQRADGVAVTFEDGTVTDYDLVIGADGIRSWTRRLLGVPLETRGTGMGIWRAFVSRPPSVTRTDLVYGGPCYIAGYCPTGDDSLYAYLVEDAQDRSTLAPDAALGVMRDLAASYHGPWDDIRARLTDPSTVNYTCFETHLLAAPWHRGRVVLAGDAVHACPPTLAQGAAQALEDAAVLAELLLGADQPDQPDQPDQLARLDGLLDTYAARRLPRATAVLDASLQVGTWMLAHERGDVPGLMGQISTMLSVAP